MSHGNSHSANVVAGILLGALIGAGLGLWVCVFIFEETLLFPGDTILIGAIVCGALGYLLGDGFIEWLKERWWWFW